MSEWKLTSEKPDWDRQPGRQFIRLEGHAAHSGACWARVWIGEAFIRRPDDPEAILGYRASDIIRLCQDGDIDIETAQVTHWMPAVFPELSSC